MHTTYETKQSISISTLILNKIIKISTQHMKQNKLLELVHLY